MDLRKKKQFMRFGLLKGKKIIKERNRGNL